MPRVPTENGYHVSASRIARLGMRTCPSCGFLRYPSQFPAKGSPCKLCQARPIADHVVRDGLKAMDD